MRFALYKIISDNKTEIRLILENKSNLYADQYQFKYLNPDYMISNYPEMSNLSGDELLSSASLSWLDYHKDIMAQNITVIDHGTFEILEETKTYKKLNFTSKLSHFNGSWVIRYGTYQYEGTPKYVLLWKPLYINDKFSCACGSKVENITAKLNNKKTREDKFAYPLQMNDSGTFEGILIAAGVYIGQANIPTLFTNEFIETFYKKYKDKASTIKVDHDHNENLTGNLTKIKLKTKPVHNIYVYGETTGEINKQDGLSFWGELSHVYSDKYGVDIALTLDIKTASIMNNGQPGCDICRIQ